MQKVFLKSQLILILILILSGCKDEQPPVEEIVLSGDKELLEYKLEVSLNPVLSDGDIIGKIQGGKIELQLPYGLDVTKLIATFSYKGEKILVGEKEQVSRTTPNNFKNAVTYAIIAEDESKIEYKVTITYSPPIPHIYITTENGVEIATKDDYVNANVTIEANGWGEDYSGKTQIKGRGNTTWGMPKKPYRLKLDKKSSLLNLAEEKDWVLLANYIDPTLMLNSVAFKIGQMIELKFTNHAIPVDLTLNGKYVGSYLFTEQVELSSSRVNINDKKGVLLELDTNYDEDFKFYSNNYKLPVMVKDPDVESDEQFQQIKSDFHRFEDALASPLFPNNNYKDFIDVESVVKFLIIYNLTHNMELNHPKSTYMYKDEGGKYTMGPIWDFDWAYGYEGPMKHFTTQRPFLEKFGHTNATGYDFFSRFLEDPKVVQLYKDTWRQFHSTKKRELLDYIDWYADRIKESKKNDYNIWKNETPYFESSVSALKKWLEDRFQYIDEEVSSL